MSKIKDLEHIRDIAKKVNYDELTNILDLLVPNILYNVIDFPNNPFDLNQRDTGGNNLLYRARILDDETKEPFKLLQDLSAMPNDKLDKIKEFGRVNKPKESMFYASTSMPIACVETFTKGLNLQEFKDKKQLLLAVGVWKIVKPMTFVQMISPEKYFEKFVLENASLNLKKVTIGSVKKHNEKIKKQIGDNEQFEILNFFSEEFAKNDIENHKDYMISNYFADRVFNRNPKFKVEGEIDGIWYPSIPSSYQETNIVLPPAIAETKLKFLWANIVWAVYFPKTGEIQFNPIEQRAKVNEQGEIEWKSKRIG